jgi:hypothetical protein
MIPATELSKPPKNCRMRKLYYALIAIALFGQFSCGPTHVVVESPAPPPPPPAEVSYQNFYDALSPYGEWINNPEYGYVWMPNVGPDFRPYASNGNWVYTDEGWTWASNYSWGWAPFHYGRWFYEDGYGWMWMPGNEWAPAWVSWRRSPDYYGWAPLGPSVTVAVAAGGGYNPPPHYWCFVPQQYVTSPHVTNYYVSQQQNVTIINNTTVIRNTTVVNNTYNNTTVVNNNVSNTRVTVNNYAGGPDPGEVSRVTGTPLRPEAVRESNTPGGNGSGGGLAIYRPRINAPQAGGGTGGSSFHPAPAHVQTLTNVQPVNTTVYSNRQPVSQPVSQPANQPVSHATNEPVSQPVNQPVSQPANRPISQPAGQPGSQLAYHPGNTGNSGNTGTGNGNAATTNHPTTTGTGNVNAHPGQPATNGNASKPQAPQGQKPKNKPKKPTTNNPNNPNTKP